MATTDPAAVVTRYIHAVRDGDSGAIRDSFAEDAIWEYPGDLPLSGTWRGRDTIVRRRPGRRRVDLPRHRPGRCRVPQP